VLSSPTFRPLLTYVARALPLHRQTRIQSHTRTSIIKNKSSYCLLLSLSLSPSPCQSRKLQSIPSLILKRQNSVRLLPLQLLPSPLTTGSVHAKTSYLQIQKMLLSVFVIGALPKGFFLSKNQ
jgi:hypothetical protein